MQTPAVCFGQAKTLTLVLAEPDDAQANRISQALQRLKPTDATDKIDIVRVKDYDRALGSIEDGETHRADPNPIVLVSKDLPRRWLKSTQHGDILLQAAKTNECPAIYMTTDKEDRAFRRRTYGKYKHRFWNRVDLSKLLHFVIGQAQQKYGVRLTAEPERI